MKQEPETVILRVRDAQGRERTITGRKAWALDALITAKARGVSTHETPAPRWSDYVAKLRRQGFQIETRREKHGGAFAGSHGRYVIADRLKVLERGRA